MLELIKKYVPKNEQEKVDKQTIIQFIENNDDYLKRTNLVAHMSSSAIVVNREMTKVLFAYHNIYDSWGWVGGHNDGESDSLYVALKEAKEETGIKNVKPYSNDILMLDVIYVFNHIKNGSYVGDHLHLNTTYLLIADENDELVVKPDENSGVAWFDIDTVFEHVSEERIKSVYIKAFKEIKSIRNSI
jgi:8-oxo-dGTP pyrophosphatase MutT (NUDIX family)